MDAVTDLILFTKNMHGRLSKNSNLLKDYLLFQDLHFIIYIEYVETVSIQIEIPYIY